MYQSSDSTISNTQQAIDLRSDTVTRPTPGMLEAMFSAQVGDDVFGEDPTVNELERKTAALFGMEAALFCPSGTMCNQIAIKVHTNPLEEIICPLAAHIYHYEVGGVGFHSGVRLRMVEGNNGILSPKDITQNINGDYDWMPVTKLVWIENTCNKGGGNYYQLAEIEAISQACKAHNLKLHIDGARLFNALVASGIPATEIGKRVDGISFCLSKGLGTPVGSMLVGSKAFCRQARRVRKVMGGGMRQAGFLAAAGIYALDYHIDRLAEDHRRAKILGDTLAALPYVTSVKSVETNIVIFDTIGESNAAVLTAKLAEQHIKAVPVSAKGIRFVTHLDFTDNMLNKTVDVLKSIRLS